MMLHIKYQITLEYVFTNHIHITYALWILISLIKYSNRTYTKQLKEVHNEIM